MLIVSYGSTITGINQSLFSLKQLVDQTLYSKYIYRALSLTPLMAEFWMPFDPLASAGEDPFRLPHLL